MKDEFDFSNDLDSILAEFSSEKTAAPAEPKIERPKAPPRPSAYGDGASAPRQSAPAGQPAPQTPRPAPRPIQDARPVQSARPIQNERPVQSARPIQNERPAQSARPAPVQPPKKAVAAEEAQPPKKAKKSAAQRLALGTVALIGMVLSAMTLLWVLVNVHPDSGSSGAAASETSVKLSEKLDVSMNNSASDALGDLTHIRKIYKIGENDTVAPMPDAARYGTVAIADAAQVEDVIQKARDSGLLDGQEVIFDPNAEFYYDSSIQYYCDDSILVICWKELIDGNTCSCVEVKIADASQFRRKIADDTYGSSSQYYASTMAKQVNSVVAMNADFYQFRDFGIVAYQRQLYRFDSASYTGKYSKYNCIDNCFVTADGNFLFMHKGDETTPEAVEQFMEDNNVIFTIAFGPILVEDGVVQQCNWYPAGEPTTGYSRAGIGIYDKLHYFYMSLNHSPEKAARWTVDEFAQQMYSKGINNAYGLDGGQTSEIVFQGEPYNYIDFGSERLVSDIIYFATAIPAEEVGQ